LSKSSDDASAVSFVRMSDATPEEFAVVMRSVDALQRRLPDQVLASLRQSVGEGVGGYQVDRLTHCLQSATRAERAGEQPDYVVPASHGQLAAAVIRPFVSPRLTWIVEHHPVFSMYHYAHLIGADRNARDVYRGHPWFDDTAYFCAAYDENCFDPGYPTLPLEHFEPLVREVFRREPYGRVTKA
jgi:predicted HD phosphohydrolase